MRKCKNILLLCIIICLCHLTLLAQVSNCSSISFGLPDRTINTKDGLLSNNVYGIIQDYIGFIYFYTDKGISKFDGHSFTNYTPLQGLPSQNIWLLSLDLSNRIWVHSHDNRLTYLLNDSIYLAQEFPNSLAFDFFQSLDKNNMKFHTGKDIYKLYIKENVYKITFLKNGIDSIDNKYNISYNIDKFNIKLGFSTYYNNLNILSKNYNKIFSLDLNDRGKWYTPTIIKNNLFLCSSICLLRFDTLLNYNLYLFPELNSINRSFIDNEDNIWVATKFDGVHFYSKQREKLASNISKGSSKIVSSFCINNRLFLFFNTSELYSYSFIENKLKFWGKFVGLRGIYPWFNNKYLISADFGIKEYIERCSGNKIEASLLPATLYGINPNFTTEIDSITILSVNYNNEFVSIKKKAGAYYQKIQLKDSFKIKYVFSDNNKIVFSNKYYISQLFKQTNIFHKTSAVLHNLLLSPSALSTNKKNILIGTEGKGIFFMSPNDSFHFIPGTEDLETKSFCTLNEWVVAHTNKGVFILKYLNNQYVIAETLTNEQGIAPEEILGVYAIDGLIRIVTKTGIHSYLPGTLPPKNYTLHITESWIGTNKITLDHLTKLKFNFEKIRLKFSLLDFEVSKDVVYQYRIQNNLPWQNLPTNQLELSEVAAGKYSLAIRAINKYTNKEFALMKIPFMVENPFWLNTGFLTFLNGLLILLFYKYYRSINKARIFAQSLLGDLSQKVKESKMKVLETQMNPHFIYNSMNSIKSYIRNKNPDTAESYLAQFSDLMRAYLDASRTSLIPMTKEMELIERYIRLERMRFSNSFDYTIDIDPEIDLDSIFMPTMVIQPFVENSIRHGLFHRRSGGELQIRLFKQNHHLIIELSDNGIGIDNSKKIQVEAGSKRRSHAMEIIKEKVNLINSLGSYKLKYTIGKLNPDSEDFPGTLTQIRIYNVV